MIELALLNSVDASVTVTSVQVDLNKYKDCAVEVSFSGTNLAGTLKLQCSCKGTVWADIANTSTAISSSGPNVVYNISGASYRYLRVVYTASSGTGNITANVTIKETATVNV